MAHPKKVLVIRLSAMGDVALCVPVLLALNKKYPDVEMITLSRKRFKSILTAIPGVTYVEATVTAQHKGALGLWRLSKELKKLKPDAIADLHNVLRSKVIRNLVSSSKTAIIDKGRAEKKNLISGNPDYFKALKHTTQRYIDVFNQLGYDLSSTDLEVLPKLDLTAGAVDYLGNHRTRWIGLAPFAAHDSKSLTNKRAKKLVTKLSKLPNTCVLLFGGGEKEQHKLSVAASTCPHVYNLAGVFTFEEELAIISNLDVMIAMDSGNGHLAAMYGVPTITLWGNTHPYAGFKPYAQADANQFTANKNDYPLIPTTIYGKDIPQGYKKAICSIKLNRVVDRVVEILG